MNWSTGDNTYISPNVAGLVGAAQDWRGLSQENPSATVFVFSGITVCIEVKWPLCYACSRDFNSFGWYRVALSIGLLVMVAV